VTTKKQVIAYIYLKFGEKNQKQIAEKMGISQQSVSRLLKRLEKNHPELFEANTPYYKILQYKPTRMDEKIRRKF